MIIDAHVHVVGPNLPGVGPLNAVLNESVEKLAASLRTEMAAAQVDAAFAMGRLGGEGDDALGVDTTLRIAELVPGLHAIGAADPRRTEPEFLAAADRQMASGRVKALKGYLGYLHLGPEHPGYVPYYQLAERYQVPFIFHTGDTFSSSAKLKYARPLLIDDVAVDFPNVRFVLAHLGNPWTDEAAEVIYKNINVWADLSGLVIGGDEVFAEEERLDGLSDLRARVRRAFRYTERPNRFIYGSDWPLAPMPAYAAFAASLIPQLHHEAVFCENARLLFRLS
jgi:predicted TIM-barrel fold metal-dependent hydrolase